MTFPTTDIHEHIVKLDNKLGGHLRTTYKNTNNLDAIIDFYFGDKNSVGKLEFEIPEKYNQKIEHLISNKEIDFDQYLVCLANFQDELPYKLEIDENNNYILDRVHISRSVEQNHFTYNQYKKGGIKLYFSIASNLKTFRKFIIKFEDINVNQIVQKSVWLYNTLASPIFYISVIILLLTILLNLQPVYSYIFVIPNLYYIYKLIMLTFFGVSVGVICSFICKFIKKVIIYSKIILSRKINNAYSDIEIYRKAVDINKFERLRPFDNIERPTISPREDTLGFNVLSASFYYNSIFNNFDPSFNKIIIIDAKKGMGKSSFINLLTNRVYGNTYRRENNCGLFKSLLHNEHINVVQFSIMPLLALIDTNEKEAEDAYVKSFVNFIANSLTSEEAKYIKSLAMSTKSISDKFDLEKFVDQIHSRDNLTQLKERIKLSNQRYLIIIEDLDRLPDDKLKIFAKSLWLICDLPFTITLLPCEASKLRQAINLDKRIGGSYEELEEHKIFQFDFSLSNYFYRFLALYTVSLYPNSYSYNYWQIDNAYSSVKNFRNEKKSQIADINDLANELKNDWAKHLIKTVAKRTNDNNQFNEEINKIIYSYGVSHKMIKDAIIEDLTYIFKTYNISIREFKSIVDKIRFSRTELFIVQQVILQAIYYRYKYVSGVSSYLDKYKINGKFEENKRFIFFRHNGDNRLAGFPKEVESLCQLVESYPNKINIRGVSSYISGIFNFMNRGELRGLDYASSAHLIFETEFIKVFLTGNGSGQELYDKLSIDWRNKINEFPTISCTPEFILSFNIIAEKAVVKNSDPNNVGFFYNLFLYQNFAILLLRVIKNDPELKATLKEYFFEANTNLHTLLKIRNDFYNVDITFNIKYFIEYYRTLFNVNPDNFIYDSTHNTLQYNYDLIEKSLITGDADNDFKEILVQIFKPLS